MASSAAPSATLQEAPPRRVVKRDPYAHWMPRWQAADMLGCSESTLQNLEKRGKLHPKKVLRPDQGGYYRNIYVYDPAELSKIPQNVRHAKPPGWAAAKCFDMLREGVDLASIVIELQESPESVRTWCEQWLDMGGSRMVVTPGAHAELEVIVGPFKTIAELIELVRKVKAA